LLGILAAIEHWLHESVVPVFDRVMRGEEELLDVTEVFSGLEMRYRSRMARSPEVDRGA
jgi:hypothetical protein